MEPGVRQALAGSW